MRLWDRFKRSRRVGVVVDGEERTTVGVAAAAHGTLHTHELALPLLVSVWLVEFEALSLGVARIEVTAAVLGGVVTVGYGLLGLGALPAGIAVDRLGARRPIAASGLGMGVAFVLLGSAPGLLGVTATLALWGAAASIYHPAGLALISKHVTDRGRGFAYHGMGGNVGIGVGPLVAVLLLGLVGWRTTVRLLALPALAVGGYALWTGIGAPARTDDGRETGGGGGGSETVADGETETADGIGRFRARSRRLFAGGLPVVFGVMVAAGLYYRGALTFLPELLAASPGFDPVPLGRVVPGAAGTIQPARLGYAGLLLVGVAGQYTGGRLADRYAAGRGLLVGFVGLLSVALLFPVAAAEGGAGLLALGAGLGFVLFTLQPFYQTAVADCTPTTLRGLSYGYTYLGVFGVGALGGAAAGGLLAAAGAGALFLGLAAVALVGALLSTRLRPDEDDGHRG